MSHLSRVIRVHTLLYISSESTEYLVARAETYIILLTAYSTPITLYGLYTCTALYAGSLATAPRSARGSLCHES
jgi:hypothetical protein